VIRESGNQGIRSYASLVLIGQGVNHALMAAGAGH